jgi:hypothetical protein
MTQEEYAGQCLVKLVEHVFQHRDGLIDGISYQDLATRIDRKNRHGVGHARGMGRILGKMGRKLKEVAIDDWGKEIPHLQSLVVKKTGKEKNLPGDGIKAFKKGYAEMSRAEKENWTREEHRRIVNFGSRWNEVLLEFSLPPVSCGPFPEATTKKRCFGSGGESPKHKELKEFVSRHPEIFGAGMGWKSLTEYALPSGDEIDVLFKSNTACIAVEVKSSVSDFVLFDYLRGIYQTVKYDAILKAMSLSGTGDIPPNIQSVLALESTLPNEYRKIVEVLGVTVYEKINPLKLQER